jgi:hypothetical protein
VEKVYLKKLVLNFSIVFLLLAPIIFEPFQQCVHAQATTLAEAIGAVQANIQNCDDAWGAVYSQIFGLRNQSVYDSAISAALSQRDYDSTVFVARLAELNDYSSQTINNSLVTALGSIPMAGSLPITYFSDEPAVPDAFSVCDRYMINAYRYAQQLGVPGWNLTKGFQDFAAAYLQPPQNSQTGEMLWINPAQKYAANFKSRYYDEYAETLGTFLEFAQNGPKTNMTYSNASLNASSFMDDAWLSTQNLWTGNYYDYSGQYETGVECEMGNFAQIIAEYRDFRGDIPYFDRVINDLQYTLLSSGFNSPGWGVPGVIRHASSDTSTSNELRLQETLGAIMALQMLYPYFTDNDKAAFQQMLMSAGQGLLSSDLYNTTLCKFRLFDDSAAYTDDASFAGLMTLFLYGIIPDTSYLLVNPSNEAYQDYRTNFQTSQWNFNISSHKVTIPVAQGSLSFLFGSQKVTEIFPSNGVYTVQFTNDWNSIISLTKIASTNNVALQPVTLLPISRASPVPTAKTTVHPAPTANPSLLPLPQATLNSTPKPSKVAAQSSFLESQTFNLICVVLTISSVLGIVYVVRKRKNEPATK